jgi:hypothetical protein
MSRYEIIFITFLLIHKVGALSGQCIDQVTHLSGAATVNGTLVTVTPAGAITSNTAYCASTLPYFIGYSNTSGEGSYTFYFLPPVSALSLNFSGITNDAGGAEEVQLYVNGMHYPIPAPGNASGCDAMAVLRPSGNIAGCPGCSVSGWKETIINGPIALLTVKDSVIFGLPNGAIFSLFICSELTAGAERQNIKAGYLLSPNPLVTEATMQLYTELKDATLILYNLYGQPVKELNHISGQSIPIHRNDLPVGVYFIRLTENKKNMITSRLIIAD